MPTELHTSIDTEDGSAVLAGTDTDSLAESGGKVSKGYLATTERLEGFSIAFAMLLGIIGWTTRDEHGFPSWSVSDWTDAPKALFSAMLDRGKVSEEDGKRLMQNVRAAWSRSSGSGNVRDAFVACYVLDNYEGSKVNGTAEVQPQQARNWTAALKVLGPDLVDMLPEILREGPFNPTNVNAAFKKGAKDQLNHYKLTVPERYGGEPKDGNAKGTKDKTPASVETDLGTIAEEAISGHVGTEGGSSHLSTSRGILRVLSSLGTEAVAASEVQDRPECEAVQLRISQAARIIAKVYSPDADASAEDLETLAVVSWNAETDK